jgi:hypothetical protein
MAEVPRAQQSAGSGLWLMPSGRGVVVALHLAFKGADGGIDRGELALYSITPTFEHLQFSALVACAGFIRKGIGHAATRQGKHGKMGRDAIVLARGTSHLLSFALAL